MNHRVPCALLAVLAACWSEPIALPKPPLPPQPPRGQAVQPRAEPDLAPDVVPDDPPSTPPQAQPGAPNQTPPEAAPDARPEIRPIPPPAVTPDRGPPPRARDAEAQDDSAFAGYVPAPTQRQLLPCGLVLATPARTPAGRIAVLRLALPFGHRFGRTGVADLAIHALAEARVGGGTGRRLRDAVLMLGGQLQIELGAQVAGVELTVPAPQWRPALALLAEALRAEPLGDEAFAELRERIVRGRATERSNPRAGTLALGLVRWPEMPAAEHLARLARLEADEIAVFQRLAFRPRGAVLALHVPGEAGEFVAAQAETTLAPWLDGAPAAEPSPPLATVVPIAGLRLASGPFAEFGLVATLPSLEEPLALESMLLLEVLSMEGLGGRIGQMLREAGAGPVAFEGTWHDEPGGSYIWLRAPTSPASFTTIWQALDLARESLRLRPPAEAELQRAAQRLRLRLLVDHEDPRRWATQTCAQILRAPATARARPFELGLVLAQLAEPARLQLGAALQQFGRNPLAMVAVGAELPATPPPGVTVLADAFVTGISGVVPADREAQAERARPHLDNALRAVGGQAAVAGLHGYLGELRVGEGALGLLDRIQVRAPDRLRRQRRVLATTIVTSATPDGGRELAGGRELPLPREEAAQLLDQATRHPLLLLAEVARGAAAYRLVALRSVQGREMAVLERDDATRERLRLLVDAESGLVRTLETREWRPGLGRVTVREEFADYRTVGGLRTPFLITTTLDDRIRIVAEWSSITLRAPTDAELEGR